MKLITIYRLTINNFIIIKWLLLQKNKLDNYSENIRVYVYIKLIARFISRYI